MSGQVHLTKLMQEIDETKFNSGVVKVAISNMVKNGEFREIKGGRVLIRIQ